MDAPNWKPVATYWLLGIIGATYVLQLIVNQYVSARFPSFMAGTGAFPGLVWNGIPRTWDSFLFSIGTDWPWRPWSIVTSTLSHSMRDPLHLIFNGMFLFFLGPSVERLVGRARFLAIFFVGGALSGIVQVHAVSWMESGYLWDPRSLALGASGALMAIFGILIVLTPKSRIYLMFFPVPMWLGGIIYAALDVLGVFNPDGVGHFAHLAGMALGLGYGAWAKADMKRRGLRIVSD